MQLCKENLTEVSIIIFWEKIDDNLFLNKNLKNDNFFSL